MLSNPLLDVHVTQSYTVGASSLLHGEFSWVTLAVSSAQSSPGGCGADIYRDASALQG